jgi:2-polyprenyl-3-methyl-5-hydroxy-6-metoxy-1,4-benzoquinol methylase
MPRLFDPKQPELMDRPQPVSPELEEDLDHLVSLNRNFGSHWLLRKFARRWLKPQHTYRVLDLATGAGDLPRELVQWGRKVGVRIQVTAVDFQESTLSIAKARSVGFPEIEWVCGDILTYQGQGGYDLVLCSLALHHFSEEDAVRVLKRCSALSRRWVLVSDLERSLFASVGIWLLTQFFYRAPMTRADARVSAQRAFSRRELLGMASAAGWDSFKYGRFLYARQAVWMEREEEFQESK